MKMCCCGKYSNETGWTCLIVDDILHEPPGAGNFCGPLIKHDLRDAQARIAALEARLAEVEQQRNDAQRVAFFAFVSGVEWWEYRKSGATIWPSDRTHAEQQAERRYPYTPHPVVLELEAELKEARAERDDAESRLVTAAARACGLAVELAEARAAIVDVLDDNTIVDATDGYFWTTEAALAWDAKITRLRKVVEKMNDEDARNLGFDDVAEFFRLVSSVPKNTPARLAAFRAWQEDDGTKSGLLALFPVC